MGKIRLSDGIDVHYGSITAKGGIDGLDSSNGISGSNYNITGVNALTINDPGEGIIFGGGSTTVTLYAIDDSTDSIMNFSNASELRVNGSKVWTSANDGGGSGLDADTVDGIQGGSFLRSDADDTVTAGTTYTWSATNTEGLVFENSSYNKKLYIGGWSSSNSAGISRIRNSNDNLHLDSGSAGNLYLNHYSAGNVYARQNLIWHAGNDGAGSGLDADTLDGYQATSLPYTPINDFNSLGTTAFTAGGGSNSTMTTAQYIAEMEGDGAFDSFSSVFKTTWSYAGNDNISDAGSFGPTETAGMSHITWTDNSSDSTRGNITVLAIAPNTGGSAGGVYVYNDQGSSYAPGWREIWTSSTDGSGSGLDADLLDGQHGSHYLNYNNLTNKPTIPTNNNQLTNGAGYVTASTSSLTNYLVKGGSWGAANMPGSRWNGFSVNGGEVAFLRDNPNTSQMSVLADGNFYAGENNGFYSLYSGNSYNTKVGFYGNSSGHFYITTTNVKANGNTIWHAGNDGSGSGLDADLLDGTQLSAIYTNSAVANTSVNKLYENATITYGASYLQWTDLSGTGGAGTNGNAPGNPFSDWHHHLIMNHGNVNGYYVDMAFSFHNNRVHFRRNANNSLSSWYEFWHTGNDGSGSGLDADTLDGNHASAFLTDVTASNGLSISGSGTTRALSMSGSYTGTFTLLGDLLPHANDTYDLGSTAKAWKELHVEDIRFHNASGAVGGIGQYNSAGDIEILSDHNIIFKETDGNVIRAVFGMNGPNFTFGQTTENTSYRVYVNGSIASTADVTAYASDERLKTNIVEIDNPIEKVKQLRGVTFDWQDDVEEKGFEPSAKHETGVIAQEVQKVIPDAVVPAPFDPDYLTVKHEKIVPLLIEAIKDQQKQIEYMKEELKTLKGEK